MIKRTALVLAALVSVVPASAVARDGGLQDVAVEAMQIPNFKVRSDRTRFGDLEYLGGIELSSPDRVFGGLSALRLLEDRTRFIGVLDTGHWITGRLERDDAGRLSGIADLRVAAMRDKAGQVVDARWLVDAEGLAVEGDDVFVSFERRHRIERHRLDELPQARPVADIAQPIPAYEFRNNRGMEALSIAPRGSPLDGALVTVSEKSLNKKGDIFAAIVTGPSKGVFFVRRYPPFDVTDGDFLPNGDLLLLERRFSIAEGVGMRIRRIAAEDIAPGRTVDGPVLIEADFGEQIDNMESLDIYESADGGTRILLASDDNHSLLQRNLILEFALVE
ncbi:esterase-like activity of phytase family protein [Nitratireductor sp. XY-223]|uniref:esterase-like activity of phytase family protein n=1 Tax=Nitratireductor sp. XY-223 TaxID=2561926 RepID=UPI0010AABD02|nr:esterase-like activity of phytase family protein [Nitratireductor sp. XY-223]